MVIVFCLQQYREISLTRLKDIWPKLDPKEDLWVWQDFKTRFKTYLRKYPLDLNSKKDQERIHLLYYRSQGNWWVMDQLVPLIPKELRKYGASTNWTISYSIEKINFNNPDINWGEFKNTKSFLNELLGGEVTSMVELKDNYLSYYEPKLKTKIFYKKGLKATLRTGVLGIRLPNYKKRKF